MQITTLIRDATGGDHPPRGALTRFAEKVGTTSPSVTRWRAGTVPDPEVWPALGLTLGLTPAELEAAATTTSTAPVEDQLATILSRIDTKPTRADMAKTLTSLTREVRRMIDKIAEIDLALKSVDETCNRVAATVDSVTELVPLVRSFVETPTNR